MNSENQLDKWDYQLILTFKRYSDNNEASRAKDIWAERCALDHEFISFQDIVSHLEQTRADLYRIHPLWRFQTAHILEESAPRNDWKYPEVKSDSGEEAYWERLLLTYASIFRHTESKYFEGLDNYHENVWKKEGKP